MIETDFGEDLGEVIKIASAALCRAVGRHAIGALALAQELAGVRVVTLPNGFKL